MLKDSLQEVNVTVVSNVACNAAPTPYKERISEEMLCAAAPGKDSCQVWNLFDSWVFPLWLLSICVNIFWQGDSGGPLTVTENRRQTLVSLSSSSFPCQRHSIKERKGCQIHPRWEWSVGGMGVLCQTFLVRIQPSPLEHWIYWFCHSHLFPGVYARVTAAMDWILKNSEGGFHSTCDVLRTEISTPTEMEEEKNHSSELGSPSLILLLLISFMFQRTRQLWPTFQQDCS